MTLNNVKVSFKCLPHYRHAVSPNNVRSKNRNISIPWVSKTSYIKIVYFYDKRFAKFFM